MIKIIMPILIGAVIGYCTNYIAIKMLFNPKKAIYIGRMKLPFTPGVIPKNKDRIAAAVAKAVNTKLISSEDLLDSIKNSNLSDKLADEILNNESLNKEIPEKIADAISEADLLPIIKDVCEKSLGEFLQNPMIAMFLGKDMLNGIYEKINFAIKDYVEENGSEKISGFINDKLDKESVVAFMDKLFEEHGKKLVENIDIEKIVESKISEMDIYELEEMIMSIMKNELQAVINLGAIIGALIGILNIFLI